MIVKCSNCESAFTVSDEKVSGKKFAFSCPNCSHNNIIDNTGSETISTESSAAAGSPSVAAATPSGSPIQNRKPPVSDNNSETADFQDSEFSFDDNFESDNASDFSADDELSDFDTTDIDDDELDGPDDEENTFSDLALDGGSPALSSDLSEDIDYDEMNYEIEPEIDLSVLSSDSSPDGSESFSENTEDDDEEITVDLDSLDIDFDDETDADSKETLSFPEEKEVEELSADLDNFDIDLDEDAMQSSDPEDDEISSPENSLSFESENLIDDSEDNEDVPIDLDSLDIDLEEDDNLVTSGPAFTLAEDDAEDFPLTSDSNTSFDLDDLDLESDEFDSDASSDLSDSSSQDDDLSIDLDNLDIDLDSADTDQHSAIAEDDNKQNEKTTALADDEINIDLDSLDIELDESDIKPVDDDLLQTNDDFDDDFDDDLDDDLFDDIAGDEDNDLSGSPIALPANEDDSDITIDLDKLNVDLDDDADQLETGGSDADKKTDSDETIDLNSLDADFEESSSFNTGEDIFDEDESISIDLDSLDLGPDTVPAETDEEDESRLSLSDAGLTLDEIESETSEASLSSSDLSFMDDGEDEDELHLTADEVNINLDDVTEEDDSSSIFGSEPDNFDEFESLEDIPAEELPELDLDRLDEVVPEKPAAVSETDIFDIGTYESEASGTNGVVGPGYIQFSVDYSLRYSRVKALLKLFGIYYILYIPHFIVLMLYMTVSSILTFINTIIVLFSSHTEKDFTAFQEKTLRYGISLYLSIFNITEELPHFAGATDIDHQLQLYAYPPVKFSRLLAFMRLSFIGMFIITLPHILILTILSFAVIFFHLLGLVSVIITGKWPSFVFDFMVRYFRYLSNICAFTTGIVDSYPSFRFD